MRIRFAAVSWILENDRANVRAIRTIQYNNLLYIILYNIYILLFIRLAIITNNWNVIRHPVTIVFIFTIVFLFKKLAKTSAA